MIGMPPVGVKLGVNCNMCVGKSVTSSDATPAIMQSQASHDLRFWCSRCKNQFVVSLIALHLYLHLHPDWHWLTAKKMVDAALHWPSPFRLASRIELWHLLATRLCSTSHTGPACEAWRFCCAGYKRSKCNPTGTSEIGLLGSLPRRTCSIWPYPFRHQWVLLASFPETPDWRSHLRSLLGLCTVTACHTVSTGTTANWSLLSLSVSLTRLLRIDMQILNCGNYWVSLGALQGKQLKLSQAHNFHLRSAALMDSKSGTPWVNLSGQDSMCHSCTAGSTGAEQLWCRLCEIEVYILGEGLCSTMRCSWHLIFQQRSTMSQMCVDLTCHLSVSFRMFIKMSLVYSCFG